MGKAQHRHRNLQSLAAHPPGKPLYLSTDKRLDVDACDNALTLRTQGSATRRIPFSRIERVICNRNAWWSGRALTHCLRSGIPIVWLDGRQQPIGSALSMHRDVNPHHVLLERYVQLPDWPQRYDNWRTRRRLETLTAWAYRLAREGRQPSAQTMQLLKREFVYKNIHPVHFPDEGHGWCTTYVVSRLQQEELRDKYWGQDGHPLSLADDLTALLWAELNFDCSASALGAASSGTRIGLFENWINLHGHRFHVHLSDLHRHLATEVETWL